MARTTPVSPHRAVSSDVTVDPGELHVFAKFLDQISGEVARIEQRLQAYAGSPRQVDFGHYPASDSATDRHHQAATRARDNATALHRETAKLAQATAELAHQYRDLAELNAALAGQVRATLDHA